MDNEITANTKTIKAYLGLFLMTTIIGLSFIFLKIGLRYTNAIDLVAHRFTMAFLTIVLLWIFGLIKVPKPTKHKVKVLMTLSLFYPILFFLFQTYGMQYSSASEAGIISAITPVFMLIFSNIFLKEKTSLLQKAGIALSVAGILYIVFNKTNVVGNISNLQGIVLLLLSVLSFVAYVIIGKKTGTKFTAIEITIYITAVSFIVFNILSISLHLKNGTLQDYYRPFAHSDFIWSILYLSVLSSVLTSFLTNYALPIIAASKIAVINNLSPIIAVVGGVVFLNEALYLYHILGGLLVMIGIFITLRFKKM